MTISIEEAVNRLERGEVIGVPTDTVYGLSSLKPFGDKIYQVKGRKKEKKLVTMVSSIEMLDDVDETLKAKMEDVWPGAVTLIYDVEGELTSFRIPDEPNLLALLEALGKPIFTTSANISGEPACLSREEFEVVFPNIGLLAEEINTTKTNTPSEIYIYEENQFERIR